MLSTLLNRPVTITRNLPSADEDEYGNEIPDEETVETVGELQQTRRDEPSDSGEVSRTTWLLVLPAGTDIRTGDSVDVDGERYELTGDPWPARNPRTRAESHVEATLIRTVGGEETS